MPSLGSIVGLVLMGLLLIHPGHAQESDDCPYPKEREIQDLAAALAAHAEWVEKGGWVNPEVAGRANFCNANLYDDYVISWTTDDVSKSETCHPVDN